MASFYDDTGDFSVANYALGLWKEGIAGKDNTQGDFFSGLGNMVTGNLDWARTQAQNAFNAQEAQKQRDFEERMSSTAHQREVADLRAAGLNPYLTLGQGATTPAGASASGTSPLQAGASGSRLFGVALNALTAYLTKGMDLSAKAASSAADLALKASPKMEETSVYSSKGRLLGSTVRVSTIG